MAATDNQPSTRTLAAVCVGSVAILALMWIAQAGRHQPGIDREAFRLLATYRGSGFDHFAKAVAGAGGPVLGLVIAATLGLLAWRGHWADVATIAGGYVAVLVLAYAAKHLVGRPRPPHPLLAASALSFPSTDSALATGLLAIAIALGGLTARRDTRIALLAVASVAVIALGALFIAVRVHYLTDVLGGWGLGVAVFAGCALAVNALRQTDRRPA